MKRTVIACFLVCGILSAGEVFKERVFMLATNMLPDTKLAEIEKVVLRAHKAGYNTVFLSDYKFGHPWKLGEKYDNNVKKAVALLRKYNFRIIAGVAPFGDNCSFLADSPQLAECLKVVDEPYTVRKGILTPVDVTVNGSFEEGTKGWRLDPKTDISVDSTVAAKGKSSLRFRVTGKEPGRQIRAWYALKTKPFQQYELSFKFKTRDLKGPGATKGVAVAVVGKVPGLPDGFRYLTYRSKGAFGKKLLNPTNDWQSGKLYFNTFEFNQVSIALGCWGGNSGEFWFDDVQIKPASFMNVTRRPGMGVKITSADGKQLYTEGKDYAKILDPEAGNFRWAGDFDDQHEPPQVKLLPGSRIKEGETVLASYYHPGLSQNHACICLNHPETKKLLTRQITWVKKVIAPEGYFMGIDEHRAYGYDPECEKSGLSAGEALNMIARYGYNEIKRIAPGAKVYMWNDMFDPFSNVKKDRYYYLIKDRNSLWNGWVGLPKDIIIMRWSPDNILTRPDAVKGSVEHWTRLGMKIIEWPGYFDGAQFPAQTKPMLEYMKKNPLCIGAAFAQWGDIKRYNSSFEKFMQVVKEVDR